jgi:hypothetical protein
MFEDAVGRLISGALWGLGAGVVVTLTRGGDQGLRSVTKGVMKGVIGIADRVQETTAQWREDFEDLAAEARAEHASQSSQTVATDSR